MLLLLLVVVVAGSSISSASKVSFLSSLEVGGVEVSTKTWGNQPTIETELQYQSLV